MNDYLIHLFLYKMFENSFKNAKFPQAKNGVLKSLFCPANSPKPKDIQFAIT